MERSREAISTIKGYYFQFDFFILQLLQLQSDNGYVQIEGIEDVDVERASNDIEAVQCKYYEGVTCTPSVVGKAIRPMLKHFAKFKDGSGGNDIRYCYRLFGYYKSGQDSVERHLTVDYVKRKFFTYSEDGKKRKLHIELKLSDSDLENFLQRLEIDLHATTYDEQIEKIIHQLQKSFVVQSMKHGIFTTLINFVWFSSTKTPYLEQKNSPLLGVHDGTAIYLLYNGILKDKSVKGGNILTKKILSALPKYDGEKIIYGSACRIEEKLLEENKIIFRQIPKELNL